MNLKKHFVFGIYEGKFGKKKALFTKNLVPGETPFEEKLVYSDVDGKKEEFRFFDPNRSKFAAYIMKDGTMANIKPGDVVLYLGASHGYTPSFISDILGQKGFIYALDFAPSVVRDLMFVAHSRKNMTVLLEDANKPQNYLNKITMVDYVYQDIAQRNQSEIFIKNCDMFLKKGGFGFIAVKARSIDVTKKPKVIFKEIRRKLEQHFTIVDAREIDPYEKDHIIFVIKKK